MAMRRDRGFLALLAFGIGIGALIAAGLRYLFVPIFDIWVQALLGLSIVGLAAGVILNPERIRLALRGRQARYGSNALVLSVAVIGIAVLVNILAFNNPTRIDLTEDQSFSLSDETLLLLSELQDEVLIKGFYTPDLAGQRDNLRPTLDEYNARSQGLVTYEFIDPLTDPVSADLSNITRDGSLAVIMGESSHVIDFPSEREISSAIIRLSNPEDRSVYFLTGHGERDINEVGDEGMSRLKDALESKNYTVASVNLLIEASIPESATVLLVAGPLAPFSEEEAVAVSTYLDSGGSLIFLQEPTIISEVIDEEDLLARDLEMRWGARGRNDLVVDLNSTRPFDGISFEYADHVITSRMQNLASYYPTARSLEVISEQDAGVSITEFVFTGENSWGETDLAGVADEGRIEFDQDADAQGPLTLALAVDDFSSGARLIHFGDSDFASNREFFNLGNGDMIVNSIDWAARQEDLINITPRAVTQRQVLPASRQTAVLISLTTLVLMPGLVAVLGTWVWWTRRKRI
jgi:ABC-type uncharacterized transport system involved in gliding motility auxiliary subunit